MPRVRPHASWLRQVESYLKDTGMTGLAPAWAMARRRPKEYRHNAHLSIALIICGDSFYIPITHVAFRKKRPCSVCPPLIQKLPTVK